MDNVQRCDLDCSGRNDMANMKRVRTERPAWAEPPPSFARSLSIVDVIVLVPLRLRAGDLSAAG